MRSFVPMLVMAMLAGPVARAAKLIAVLPLDVTNSEGKLSKSAQASIEEMLRDVATEALTAGGWTVLSTQNQLQLLVDNGVDPTKCGEQNCQLATAREIKAEKFISGAVQYSDGSFTASIRMIDTETGRILASERLKGKTASDLRDSFEAKSSAFFAKAGLGSGSSSARDTSGTTTVAPDVQPNGPRVKKSAVTAAVGTLTIAAKPRDAVRLDLVDPGGAKSSSGGSYENKAAKPGTWKVRAQASGYEEQTVEIEVPADDVAFQKIELKLLGSLKITGTPAGAAVSVSGPGGFRDEGGLPWEAEGLRSGSYNVKVTREGYGADEQSVEVKPGEPTQVRVKLEKGGSGGGAGMVRIPGGTFQMGAEDISDREKPVHQVTLSPYFMDRTEVTVAAYAACVKAGKCSGEGLNPYDTCNWGKAGRDNHPINCVDWNQAKAYCEAQGGRLPTEAEWEFAARGTDGRKYPWGSQEPNATLAKWSSSDGTDEVGKHPSGASPFGLQDMAGNVWEWVADAYGRYPSGSQTNPKQESGQNRVVRGGSWYCRDAAGLRGADRRNDDAAYRNFILGFRCARGAVP